MLKTRKDNGWFGVLRNRSMTQVRGMGMFVVRVVGSSLGKCTMRHTGNVLQMGALGTSCFSRNVVQNIMLQ